MIHKTERVDCKFKSQNIKIPDLSQQVRQVSTHDELGKVRVFRRQVYSKIYPEITNFEHDPFDELSIIFYHTDDSDVIDGTLRCSLDSELGLPDEKIFAPFAESYRLSGLKIAEAGRTAVEADSGSTNPITSLYSALYLAVKELKVDVVFICVPQKKVRFHQRIWNTEILNYDTAQTFGSNDTFSALAWHVTRTQPSFHRWIAEGTKSENTKAKGEQ